VARGRGDLDRRGPGDDRRLLLAVQGGPGSRLHQRATCPALHTLTVRVAGTKNADSAGMVVSADRADVLTPPPVVVNDNTIGTGPDQFEYPGNWEYASGNPAKYEGDDPYSNNTGSSARIVLEGARIVLYGSKAPWHGIAAVSIDGGPATPVDYYAPTRQDGVALYTSPRLALGSHTVLITVTGTKNPAAADTVVTVDRIEAGTATPAGSYLSTSYDTDGFFQLHSAESDYFGYRPEKTYNDATPISLFAWLHGCGGVARDDLWKIAPPATRKSQSYVAISWAAGTRPAGTSTRTARNCWRRSRTCSGSSRWIRTGSTSVDTPRAGTWPTGTASRMPGRSPAS
jgi:hypothetical protein